MIGKYVIVDNFFPVLIPDAMPHDRLRDMNITSAGFFRAYVNEAGALDVAVHGHSESLSIQSHPTDVDKIRITLKMRSIS